MPRALASRMSQAPHSRTWATLPGADSSSGRNTVWMESTTSARGLSASSWLSIIERSVSATRYTPSGAMPSRSARSLICAADSSPER